MYFFNLIHLSSAPMNAVSVADSMGFGSERLSLGLGSLSISHALQ